MLLLLFSLLLPLLLLRVVVDVVVLDSVNSKLRSRNGDDGAETSLIVSHEVTRRDDVNLHLHRRVAGLIVEFVFELRVLLLV